MKRFTRRGVLALGLSGLAACSTSIPRYDGPPVTRIEVHKDRRRMYLLNERTVLRAYDIQLGFTAEGPKKFEGDGRTPEGRYFIDRRNPNSSFYLSLGISYPNAWDVTYASSRGKSPGGDIFIHGWGHARRGRSADWTAGCIAVTNREMREIFAMVQTGTVIDIYP